MKEMLYQIARRRDWLNVPILLCFFLFFSKNAYAKNDLVVSDVCAPRALEMNLFSVNGEPVRDLDQVRQLLRKQNVGNQTINFQNLANSYSETLDEINRQLKDYKSSLFVYLTNCRNDSAKCHGYFNVFKKKEQAKVESFLNQYPMSADTLPFIKKYYSIPKLTNFLPKATNNELSAEEKFRRNIYCDREIYRSVVGETYSANKTRYEECQEAPFIAEIGYTEELSKSRDLKTCFYKIDIDGQTFLKNKFPEYQKKYEVASYWYDKAPDLSLKAIQASFLPLGFLFIMRKSFEEFQDISNVNAKSIELNQYYAKLRVAKVFYDFDDQLLLPEQQQSQMKINKKGSEFLESLRPKDNTDEQTNMPKALTFNPDDFYTKIVFAEAERQHWIERLQYNSPLILDPDERLEYFKYLNRNPFFFNDQTSTFQDFVKNPGVYSNQISPNLYVDELSPAQFSPSPDVRKKMGYNSLQSFEPYGPPREIQPGATPKIKPAKPGSGQADIQKMVDYDRVRSQDRKITTQFLFDKIFNKTYMDQLKKDQKRKEENSLEYVKQKWTMYNLMFHKVKLYQFNRVTEARVYREIQKKTQHSLKSEDPFKKPLALDNYDKFHTWIDNLMCKGSKTKYCSKDHENFRKTKHHDLFDKISSDESRIQYVTDPDQSTREYIYDESFLREVNQQIASINQFCYDHATNNDYAKNPELYEGMIKDEMKSFYSINRLDDLLNESGSKFAEVFKYDAEKYVFNCFTRGYVFDDSLKQSELAKQKIQEATTIDNFVVIEPDEARALAGLKFNQIYVPSKFQVTLKGLHSIEDHIEETIDDELKNLDEIYDYKNLGNYESYLKDSGATRIGALLDYIADSPDEEIAKYICHLIKLSDAEEYQSQKNRETAGTIAIILASIPTFYMPAVFVGTVTLYRASTALLITAASSGAAWYKIQYYNNKKDQLDAAGITKSMDFKDSQLIQQVYSHNTVEARNTILVDLALLVVFSGKAIYEARTEINNFFSTSFREEAGRRSRSLTETTRDSAGKLRLKLSRQVESFIFNKNKVTTAQFYDGIMKKLLSGGAPEVEKYLLKNFGKEIGKFVEIDIFNRRINELKEILKDPQSNAKFKYPKEILEFLGSSKVSESKWEQFKLAFFEGREASDDFLIRNWENELGPILTNPIPSIGHTMAELFLKIPGFQKTLDLFMEGALYTKTYFNKWVYDFKTSLWSFLSLDSEKWYKFYPYKLFEKEKWLIKIIHDAQTLEKETGHQIFSQIDIEAFAQKMKFFFLDDQGFFRRVYDRDMRVLYKEFLENVISGPRRAAIEKYLEPLIGGELLKDDWINVLKSFIENNEKITSIDDCKAFLKSLKYAARQYSTLRSQAHNFGEIMSWQELTGTYVYIHRSKEIVQKMLEIYKIAKYTKYKNDVAFVIYLRDYFEGKSTNTVDFENEVKNIDPDFKYADKLKNLKIAEDYVYNFEKSHPDYFEWAQDKNGNWSYTLKKVIRSDPFKYEKDFIAQETRYREDFQKLLKKYFKKFDKPVEAYQKALDKIQERKMVEFECSLPQSYHKETINRLYRKTVGIVSLGTGVMGYYAAHGSEEKNTEWWSRFSYEVSISIFSGYIMSRVFTKTDGGPLYKVSHEFRNGLIMSLIDAGIYSGVNNIWNNDSKVTNDLAQSIYQSDNLRATIQDFLKTYPDYADRIIDRLGELEKVMDDINIKLAKGTMVTSDVEKELLKQEFLEDLTNPDGSFSREKLMKDPLYQKIVGTDHLDDVLFEKPTTDHDWQNQVKDILGDIKYNEAYEHKSGEIKLPLLPAWDIGTIDWPELKTGSETLDRLIYYPVFYDIPKTPFNYLKNYAIYNVLCNKYWTWPGRSSEVAAILINAVYKSALDPYKFYMREQVTGH